MLEPGSQIDKYEIIAPLAAGGMAVVYRARHQYLGREVALKILSSHLSLNEKVRERFAQEAYVQGQLDHPHIMPVLDFVSVGSVLGIVMPLIEGLTLAEILADERQDPLSADDLMLLLGPVVSALSYAHGRDLIHRDLKPANVMYERKPGCEWPGRALVADFGLAKVLNTSLGPMLTRAGTTMGTPPYMAPEQYGASPEIGLQADVHALGMMAWQMLSGTLPFVVGDRIAEAKYYTGQTLLEDPESFGKGVKDSLVSEVKRACAIEVADRTDTAVAFAAALDNTAGGKWRRKKAIQAMAAEGTDDATASPAGPHVAPGQMAQKLKALSVAVCVLLAMLIYSCASSIDLESKLKARQGEVNAMKRDKTVLSKNSSSLRSQNESMTKQNKSQRDKISELDDQLLQASACYKQLVHMSRYPGQDWLYTRINSWRTFLRTNRNPPCKAAGGRMADPSGNTTW